MSNRAWRPDQGPLERLTRWFMSRMPNSLGGESPNPFGAGVSSAALGAMQQSGENDELGVSHFYEILKAAGVSPSSSYFTTYLPLPADDGVTSKWPLVVAGGVEQVESIDYNTVGNKITILPAMDLQANELLFCRYDYRDDLPNIYDDPWDAFTDHPIDVKLEYFTTLGRDYFSVSFATNHGKTPADGWAWSAEPAYVDDTGAVIYDGRNYPMRSVPYNTTSGRWELIHQQNPNIDPRINRVTIQSAGPGGNSLNPPGLQFPEWQITDTPVFVGPVV